MCTHQAHMGFDCGTYEISSFWFFSKNIICAWCVHIRFLHIRYVKAQLCINVWQQYYWYVSRTEEEPKLWKLRTEIRVWDRKFLWFSKIPEFLIVGCHNNVPDVFKHIILNTVGYTHSINSFVRQKVCGHKRHIILVIFHSC